MENKYKKMERISDIVLFFATLIMGITLIWFLM